MALGAIWGASFMFIKIGGAEVEPFALVEMRLALAALVMLGVSAFQPGTYRALLANWRAVTVMGVINCAVPYTLITWGEVYISSGLAAIYNACAPLWAAGILLFMPQLEKMSAARIVGLFVGLAGVVMVVSGTFSGGTAITDGTMHLVGQGAVLLAALSYALSGIYGRKALKGVPTQVAATGQLVMGALILLPLALFQIPASVPSLPAIGAIVTLAVAGTSLASLMYYWLLKNVGATGALLVTYLLPGFALLWGALFLGEAVTLPAVLGLGLVLLGIAITSGSGASLVARLRGRQVVRDA